MEDGHAGLAPSTSDGMTRAKLRTNAHAGSRTRVTSMGGLYDAATLHALMLVLARLH